MYRQFRKKQQPIVCSRSRSGQIHTLLLAFIATVCFLILVADSSAVFHNDVVEGLKDIGDKIAGGAKEAGDNLAEAAEDLNDWFENRAETLAQSVRVEAGRGVHARC